MVRLVRLRGTRWRVIRRAGEVGFRAVGHGDAVPHMGTAGLAFVDPGGSTWFLELGERTPSEAEFERASFEQLEEWLALALGH
jgi:hypothetical protein